MQEVPSRRELSIRCLAGILLCLYSLSICSYAEAPSVTYSGPTNITHGGTVTGNFKSTDSDVPCIKIMTTEPVTIQNCILAGAGNLIDAQGINGSSLTIINNQAYGLTPSKDNTMRGRFLEMNEGMSARVEHNYFESCDGIHFYLWGGDGSASQTITVRYNSARNLDGRYRNGGGSYVNFIGMNGVYHTGNIEISWNQVINVANESLEEDNINFYNSGGTAGSHVKLHDNYIFGAYPYPATSPIFTGSGIMMDGDATTADHATSFVDAYSNQLVATCAGTGIASGHDNHFFGNRVVTSKLIPPDGVEHVQAGYAGIAIWNAYSQSGSVFFNNSMDNITVGFVVWDGDTYIRRDVDPGANNGISSVTLLPDPINLATEANEWTIWQQKLTNAGVIVGPLANVRNVTDYGAIPNDGNDDAAAIQAVIDASGVGDTVYLPAGVYRVSQELHPKSDIMIKGAGQSQSRLLFTGGTVNMIYLTHVSRVEICDLTLSAAGNALVGCGILADNGQGHNFHHLTISDFMPANTNVGSTAIHLSESVTDSLITDNTIANISTNSNWGCGIRVSWGSSRTKILRNTISMTGRGGIFGNDGSSDLIIRENNISGSGQRTEGLGIEIWVGCDRSIIEDNHVDSFLSVASCRYVAVRRNTISDTTGRHITIGLEAVSDNCIYTDNTINDGHCVGLSISGSERYEFFGRNAFQAENMWGAQFQGDASIIKYMYFHENSFSNMPLLHANPPYPGSEGMGFRFNGNVDYVDFENCEFNGNGRYGIQFTGGNINHISMRDCKIQNNADGAFTSWSGTGFEMVNCTVSGNGNNSTPAASPFSSQRPTSVISSASAGNVGQTISFDSSSSSDDGSIAHRLWDFGDGYPSDAVSTGHVYSVAGTYRVTLIVWDDEGRGERAEKTVVIGGGGTSTETTTDYEAEDGTCANGAQVQTATSASGGEVVGNINSEGAYSQVGSVDGGTAGEGSVVISYANGYPDNRSLSLYVNGAKIQQVVFPTTGGWNVFQDTAPIDIILGVGATNTIKLQRDAADSAAADVDKYTVTVSNTPPPPFQGTHGNGGNPWAVTSTGTTRIEAENYDDGGEGVAYHDADATNNGEAYRTSEGVDIEGCSGDGSGYDVGWTGDGEWQEYTLDVASNAVYAMKLRIARAGNGSMRVLFDGVDKTGTMDLPVTGGWQTFTNTTMMISLAAGQQVMRVETLSDGFNINWIELSPAFAPKGTPVSWLQHYGFANDFGLAEDGDPDFDELKTWEECITGTDPTNGLSVFEVIDIGENGAPVRWYGTTNGGVTTAFRMLKCTNLEEGVWNQAATNIARSGTGTNFWSDPSPVTNAPVFYRPAAVR